jgi:5'(3')-deoxyribonucleotidase
MKLPLIAIDIDDTIADSTESVRLLANMRTGANITPAAYRVAGDFWGYYERVWATHGITGKIIYNDLAAEMIVDQSHIPLLPGALMAIKQLAQRYAIVLITARDQNCEAATRRWLAQQFPGLDVEVYFAASHHNIRAKTKGQICKDLGAEVLIDDNVEHCESALEESIDAILFGEYGWHSHAGEHLARCKDWQAVLEYFDARA